MKRHQLGFSLVELMVAIVISSLLILGVTEIFSRSFFADRDNTELTYMQESGRLALELIGQDARRAGFQGCTASNNENSVSSEVTLPGGAVSWTDNNLTFVYFEPNDRADVCGAGNWKTVTYTSSASGISRTENGATQPILNNARFARAPEFLPSGQASSATSLTVYITVNDQRQAGELLNARAFNATFELRNRLQ